MCKLIFGITGATGTGKSTVSDIMREFGIDVIDADKAAREVVKKGTKCLSEIVSEFGDDVLEPDGTLNRRHLGDIVFSDNKKLEILTEITHKYIKEYVLNKINNSKSDICAIDGAVLIGSNMEKICSFMVSVISDEEIRKARIMSRDGISEKQAIDRIKSQPNEDYYIRHADYVIKNDKDTNELRDMTEEIYNKIIKERVV